MLTISINIWPNNHTSYRVMCDLIVGLSNDVQDTDYELCRLDRDRHGGGGAIYIDSHIAFSVISSGLFFLIFL